MDSGSMNALMCGSNVLHVQLSTTAEKNLLFVHFDTTQNLRFIHNTVPPVVFLLGEFELVHLNFNTWSADPLVGLIDVVNH